MEQPFPIASRVSTRLNPRLRTARAQGEFDQAREIVDSAVAREKMKSEWLGARFDLIQAELGAALKNAEHTTL